eukprot:CAMPEP_0185156570 /NCGR_PEP_ID=MMETSP1139-20130426/1204_1 /TAXON_ID=298111 /ORGANISM="Pavlova sp., Strain CCMP459" /LENGTH=214 /DNA_ID=CAMNT_0027721575 /DNA_START=124 /DNA_END=768 /DNA_ORIENTATION=+
MQADDNAHPLIPRQRRSSGLPAIGTCDVPDSCTSVLALVAAARGRDDLDWCLSVTDTLADVLLRVVIDHGANPRGAQNPRERAKTLAQYLTRSVVCGMAPQVSMLDEAVDEAGPGGQRETPYRGDMVASLLYAAVSHVSPGSDALETASCDGVSVKELHDFLVRDTPVPSSRRATGLASCTVPLCGWVHDAAETGGARLHAGQPRLNRRTDGWS